MAEYEAELLRRRRDHLILRVDRADLSKNVLRGFTAFDTFLQQHPEFRERVTFIAHLQPSRTDVPEYAEYLERIEALVAVVNHRHGTTDWMPIDLRIYENFPEAVARYKHFDLLIVNSLFDGMNLVAKEAPAVNTRDGVVMLSENTGAHEELGDCTLVGQPVRHPGAGGHDLPRADHGRRGARAPGEPPPGDRPRARSGRLDRRAARRHPGQARGARGRLAAARVRGPQPTTVTRFDLRGPGLVRVAALLRDHALESRIAAARWWSGSGTRPCRCRGHAGEAASHVDPAASRIAPESVTRRPRFSGPGSQTVKRTRLPLAIGWRGRRRRRGRTGHIETEVALDGRRPRSASRRPAPRGSGPREAGL